MNLKSDILFINKTGGGTLCTRNQQKECLGDHSLVFANLESSGRFLPYATYI